MPFHVLALDGHTCDFVAGSVIPIRYYFRPSNGHSEPTVSMSIALKSREQGTSSPPWSQTTFKRVALLGGLRKPSRPWRRKFGMQ